MAKLYIREFSELPNSGQGHKVAIGGDYGYDQAPVSFSTSAQSAAFRNETKFVRLHTDSACSVLLGNNPTATANNARMAADSTEYFGVRGGDKVAVISNS